MEGWKSGRMEVGKLGLIKLWSTFLNWRAAVPRSRENP
jgi:hypothetical protein